MIHKTKKEAFFGWSYTKTELFASNIECGLCANECSLHNNICGGKTVEKGNPLCSKCYHCFAVCPNGAITIEGLKEEATPVSSPAVAECDLLRLLAGRRSSRR